MIYKRSKWLIYLLIYLLLFSYHLAVLKYQGDDFYFSKASVSNTLIPWLNERYHTWSGRLFPDAMAFILLRNWVWIWRIINSILIMLLAYSLVRIWKKKVELIEFLTALVILGYFNENTIISGFFWITGSLNYLWPITLGIVAMIPYADYIFRNVRVLNIYQYILSLIIGFLASIGNEQAALCMSCFAILAHLELVRKKRKQDKKLILLTLTIIVGTCILLFAPGNYIRWGKEVAYWYPGFGNLSFKDHIYIGVIWGFEKLFHDMRNLILLLSGLAIIFSLRDKETRNNKIFQSFTCLFTIILLLHINGLGLAYLYGFEEMKHFRFSLTLFSSSFLQRTFILAFLPYIFWTIYSFMLVFLLLKNSKNRIFGLFTFLAVVATFVVMFFSPTIYASGNRVLMVGSVLIDLYLVGRIIENKLINTVFPYYIFGCYPLINLLHILYKWISNGYKPYI